MAECNKGYKPIGGDPEYVCSQSANGSQAVWREGSIVCEVSCDPGFAPTADTTETGPCDSCDEGRFSFDGKQCLPCVQPNENRTLCSRCVAGFGPNRDHTVCEECAEALLVEKGGVCVAKQQLNSNRDAGLIHAWDNESLKDKGLTIGGLLLAVLLGGCCVARWCSRRYGPEEERDAADQLDGSLYVADLAVFIVVTALAVAALTWSTNDWEKVCVVVSALSWLPVPCILRRFKRTLAELQPIRLSEESSHLGIIGVCMFAWGLLDFVRGPWLCISLGLCKEGGVLFSCCTATLVVTTVTTGHLALTVLDEVKKTPAAAAWVAEHDKLVACVGIAASSRLDMIAILRLKLVGKVRCGLPMEDKHFHFCRHAGMYHYLIEDMPHALIAFAKWRLGCDDGDDGSASDGDGLVAWFALGSAGLSACSIIFGLVNKAVQMRIARGGDTMNSSVSLLNTATRDYIAGLQEENRQLRESRGAQLSGSEQGLGLPQPRDSGVERS